MKWIITAWKARAQQKREPATEVRKRDEYEFLPAYLEVVERPAPPWTRRTALAISSLLIAVLVWSIVGQLDIHAAAAGRVIVSSHSKVIQPLVQGEIAAINVRDGQKVKSGDILIQLNPIGAEAEVRRVLRQYDFYRLERERYRALLATEPTSAFKAPDDISSSQVTSSRELLHSEWLEIQSALELQDAEIEVNQANQTAANRELLALNRLKNNITIRLRARETLAESHSIGRVELLEQQRELLELERNLSQQHSQLTVLKAQQLSLKERRDNYLATKRKEYFGKLNEMETNLGQLEQELIKVREQTRLQNLRTPVDGVVQQLSVHTLGGVVQPAQQLMVIVPDTAPLEVEVMILNKDVGFVTGGQPAEVKLDAFPFTKYGTIKGELIHVSKDAVKDEQRGLVFPAKVRLVSTEIEVDGKWVSLQAGMSITAEIKTGKRRVIEYLLSPLQQYQSEALRER